MCNSLLEFVSVTNPFHATCLFLYSLRVSDVLGSRESYQSEAATGGVL